MPRPIRLAVLVLATALHALVAATSSSSLHDRAFVLDLDGAGNLLHWVLGGSSDGVPYRLLEGNAPFGSDGERAIHESFATWSRASSTLA